MKILAVDTSSNACSVALQVSGEITERHVIEPRAHTRVLLPMISELLSERDISIRDLNAIVLGNGPGSFIGMRIGASVVQGLCFAAEVPVAPVSSLAAIAVEAFADYPHDTVAVAQDARMNEIYLAWFRKGANGLPELIDSESIESVGELSAVNAPYAAAGGAWEHYPDLFRANRQQISAQLPISVPRAKHLLPPGLLMVETDQAIAPEFLAPAYLRTKVAEKPSSPQ